MKKINKHFLADVSLELSPLSEDNEGQLRGGFAGLGGNEIELNEDEECTNDPCVNNGCVNEGCTGPGQGTNNCVNKKCRNICTNNNCSTTKPTEPHGSKNVSFSLLI